MCAAKQKQSELNSHDNRVDYGYLGVPVIHSCLILFLYCSLICRFITYDPHFFFYPIRKSLDMTILTHTQTTQSNGADTCKVSQSHMHALVNTPSNTHCIIACRNTQQLCMQCGWKACRSVWTLIRLCKIGLSLCYCDRLHTNE